MEQVVLGRTGLEVSRVGLGCGGRSRLGLSSGSDERDAVEVVHRALDLGITYFDTAESYGTEGVLAKGLGNRTDVIVSTKVMPERPNGAVMSPSELRGAVETSLQRLGRDCVDVFHLHGVSTSAYRRCAEDLVPELESLRREGSLRYLAISERFGAETAHEMLERAVEDDCWDVMMVGFHVLNQSARRRVLPAAIGKNIGVEVMFALRRVLSRPDALRQAIAELMDDGRIDASLDRSDPLGFLVGPGGSTSVQEAAYRFATYEPGCHVVLTGTGSVEHLEENIRSVAKGPLAPEERQRLVEVFGHLDHISGN